MSYLEEEELWWKIKIFIKIAHSPSPNCVLQLGEGRDGGGVVLFKRN
jgi:hypothetical protein